MAKRKGKKPEKGELTAGRKLTDRDIEERQTRFHRKFSVVRGLEKQLSKVSKELRSEIKAEKVELDKLHDEIESGYEQLAQGDLFAEKTPQPIAVGTLGELGARTGEGGAKAKPGNGAAPRDEALGDPPQAIDVSQADAVRRAANGKGSKNWRGKSGPRPQA